VETDVDAGDRRHHLCPDAHSHAPANSNSFSHSGDSESEQHHASQPDHADASQPVSDLQSKPGASEFSGSLSRSRAIHRRNRHGDRQHLADTEPHSGHHCRDHLLDRSQRGSSATCCGQSDAKRESQPDLEFWRGNNLDRVVRRRRRGTFGFDDRLVFGPRCADDNCCRYVRYVCSAGHSHANADADTLATIVGLLGEGSSAVHTKHCLQRLSDKKERRQAGARE